MQVAHFTFDVDNRSNSGTARVAREVILSLARIPQLRQSLVHFQICDDAIYSLEGVRELRFKKFRLPIASGFCSFMALALMLRIRRSSFDIAHWHSSRVYPFFFLFPARRHVVTLHDINQKLIPGADTLASRVFRINLWISRRKVDLIIGVSNHASRNIVLIGGFPEKKVKTLYWGSRFELLTPKRPQAMDIDSGFLLVVSRWQPYKNVHSVVRAYLELLQQGHALPRLVLVGKPVGSFTKPYELANASKVFSHKVLFLQDLTDEELAYMYDHCLVNIAPSLYEGFGLSVLEAMKRKKFSLCHSGTATSEIVGESGIAIDMHDISSIKRAILKIVDSPSLVQELNAASWGRGLSFNWNQSSSQLFEMYLNLQHA